MKKLLSKILPASAKAFHTISAKQYKLLGKILSAVKSIITNLSMQDKKIDDLQKSQKILSEEISTSNKILFEQQNKKIETMQQDIKNLKKELQTQNDLLAKQSNDFFNQQVSKIDDLTVIINNLNEIIPKIPQRTYNKSAKRIKELEKIFLRLQKQPRLAYFVLNIVSHCNLKCKGCDHFAPIAEEHFVPLQTIESDLQQMSQLTAGAVTRIGIMGGEPLLHPNLLEILQSARKAFPNTLLQCTTNGVLLLQQSEEFWQTCKNNNIHICVTKYPINLDFESMEKIALQKGVNYSYYHTTATVLKTSRKIIMDIDGTQNPKRSFYNCFHANTLPLLMYGKLYPCTVAPNAATIFNKKFSTNMLLENGDFLDIYKCTDSNDILTFLHTPKPFCRYCKTTERIHGITWEQSKQNISEWT